MAEFWTTKMAKRGFEKYMLVTDETKLKLSPCGLDDWEVFSQFGCWDFVAAICKDDKAMAELKNLFFGKDKKPLLANLTSDAFKDARGKRNYPPKDLKKENFFNGTTWYGTLSEDDDAWILSCYTRRYNLS